MLLPTFLLVLVGVAWQLLKLKIARFDSFFKGRKVVLLLFAHPDDEVMFFLPTIKKLSYLGIEIVVGCLSTGNADGLGETRKLEFLNVMKALKIDKSVIVDDDRIPDGFKAWDPLVVKDLTQSILDRYTHIDTILTFDRGGVSGHPNHVSIADASLLEFKRPIKVVQLVSVPTLLKYAIPPLDILSPWDTDLVSINSADPAACSNLMKLYASQNVWFRRLFTLFSRYAYINTLRLV